jgi:transcriptional regulator with XRE-family HTH domain
MQHPWCQAPKLAQPLVSCAACCILCVMTEMMESRRSGWIADDSTFGARLALVRQRMGWGNVKEAADACGIPVESWRRWERDNRAPRDVADVAWQIAERTGADYGWLLAGPRLVDEQAPAVSAEPRVVTRRGRRADNTGSAATTVQPGYRAVRPTNGPRRPGDPRPVRPTVPAAGLTHPADRPPTRAGHTGPASADRRPGERRPVRLRP